MSEESSGNASGGCSCVGCVVFILMFWAIFFGLTIGDKKWNIDFFPPRIWDMNEKQVEETPVQPKTSTEEVEEVEEVEEKEW